MISVKVYAVEKGCKKLISFSTFICLINYRQKFQTKNSYWKILHWNMEWNKILFQGSCTGLWSLGQEVAEFEVILNKPGVDRKVQFIEETKPDTQRKKKIAAVREWELNGWCTSTTILVINLQKLLLSHVFLWIQFFVLLFIILILFHVHQYKDEKKVWENMQLIFCVMIRYGISIFAFIIFICAWVVTWQFSVNLVF